MVRASVTGGKTRFLSGHIEELDQLEIEPGSIDVIVSNCVINLSPEKAAVFEGAHRLLKPGGEMYFSDVYADRRVPSCVSEDPVLYGECLGGALYWGDFLRLARASGFIDPRLVESRPIAPQNEAVATRIAGINYYSATYRLFRIDGLEDACEDYGQAVVYKGSIAGHEHSFALDTHHRIDSGRVFPVCGNTSRMLAESRFAEHFEFIGNRDKHYGIFPGCGSVCPFEEDGSATPGACC